MSYVKEFEPRPSRQRKGGKENPKAAEEARKKQAQKQLTMGLYLVVALLFGMCAIVVIAAAVSDDDTSSSSSSYSSSSSSFSASSSASDRRQGFHCLSDWDGNHDGMEALIRARLSDPVSMSTIGTRIGSVTGGRHPIALEFTAENAYGGTVRYTARGWVNQGTCRATLNSVQDW